MSLATNGYEALKDEVNSWTGGDKEEPKFFDLHPNRMDSLMGYILKFFTPTVLILAFAQNTSSLADDLEKHTLEVEIYG